MAKFFFFFGAARAVAALALVTGLAAAAAGATHTVNVQGAGCAAGAQVAAVSMGPQGPDRLNSRIVTADSGGAAVFSGLVSTAPYQFMAVNTGCVPSLRDQAMNPDNMPRLVVDGGSKTIVLSQDNAGATVTVGLTLSSGGTFPKLVMGGCRNNTSFEDAAFGMSSLSTATGTIVFYNLPPAAANTYHCGVFSPSDNRGGGTPVSVQLSAGQNMNGLSIDLTQSFAPPSFKEDQASREGSQGGGGAGLSVYLTRQSDGNPVAGAQLKLKTSPTGGPIFFSGTDPQGVGNFFGLANGTTYYLDIFVPGLEGKTNMVFHSGDWTSQPRSTAAVLGAPTGGGTISGVVRVGGVAVPHVWVNCRPDFRQYQGSDPLGGNQPMPGSGFGFTDSSDGNFSLANMPMGNYECDVNTPFSNQPALINFGADNQMGTSDDRRLSISTAGVFQVFNNAGGLVSAAAPVQVNILVDTSTANGTISGSLSFPASVDLSAAPVTIIAHEEFSGGPGARPRAGFAVVNGTGAIQSFSLNVPTGTKYHLEVKGSSHGPTDMGMNNFADLTGQSSVTGLVFKMVGAGSVQVKVLGPDGTRFLPKTQPEPGDMGDFSQKFCGGHLNAEGENVHAWGSGQLSREGDVTLKGLPEGRYTLRFGTYGSGCSVADAVVPGVLVAVGRSAEVTVNLKRGVPLEVRSGTLPAGTGIPQPGPTPPSRIARVVAFPRGTALTFDRLRSISGRGGNTAPINLMQRMAFNPPTGQQAVAWLPMSGGGDAAPKVTPGQYTFYLLSEGSPNFDPNAAGSPGFMYMTVLGQANAILDEAHKTTPHTLFGSSVVAVNLPSAFGSGTVTGSIRGNNIFTRSDFNQMGGDFEKFLGFVPICAAFNNENDLLGFGMGSPTSFGQTERNVEDSVQNRDPDEFMRNVPQVLLRYGVPLLPAGRHTLVCTTPNYPPVVKQVTVAAGGTTTVDVDFDGLVGAGGTVSGVVRSTAGVALSGASVSVRTRSSKKAVSADASGAYSVGGLPDGIYHVMASNGGYASATEEATVQSAGVVTVNFGLTAAPGRITGTVVASAFPNRKVAAGVKVVAYDGTLAGQKLSVEPPSWETQTGDDGTYELANPTPGNVVKIFAVADGKVVVGTTTVATAGAVTAPDIVLLAMPPVATVQVRPKSGGKADLMISVPKLLTSKPSVKCSMGTTYADASATDFSSAVVSAPGNAYVALDITLPSAAGDNVCRVTTQDGAKTHTVDAVVGADDKAKSVNSIDRAAVTGGSATLDADDESSGSLDFHLGSLEFAAGAVPTCQISKGDAQSAGLPASTGTIASDVYVVTLSSAAQISAGRELSLTLAVDKDKALDPNGLRVAQVIGGQIVDIPAKPFYDPITGSVTVEVKSIDDAPAASALGAPALGSSRRFRGLAVFKAGQFSYNAQAAATQTGTFLVLSNATQGGSFSGAEIAAYNFPNPFNLKSKTLTLTNGGSVTNMTTTGTLLRYDLPAGRSGKVVLRVYTLSGDLVDELVEGDKSGGYTYYVAWDGKNKDGEEVANGVYFAVVSVAGENVKESIVKMVVLK